MNKTEIFKSIGVKYETDKVSHHGYHFQYPTFLSEFRDEEFNLLELGYLHGNSHSMWLEYFPKAKIFSADICSNPVNENHVVLQCDQSNREDIKKIANEIKCAKVIIDDATHQPSHQAETFHYLFTNLLSYGGVYIIEDVECNYWNPEIYNDIYRIGVLNCIDYTKSFIDQINSEFSGKKNTYQISSITYAQNCIIIKKQTEEEISFFNRSYRFFNCL